MSASLSITHQEARRVECDAGVVQFLLAGVFAKITILPEFDLRI